MWRNFFFIAILLALSCQLAVAQVQLKQATDVETQPLIIQCQRLAEALEYLGAPLNEAAKAKIANAEKLDSPEAIRKSIQSALDPLCVAEIEINPESRVKVNEGPAKRELDQNGWRVFLVKVHNQAGVTAPLRVQSDQAAPIAGSPADQVPDRWLDIQVFDQRPLAANLSGIQLEYRPLLMYSRDIGKRTAEIAFNVGQGTQDIGFRNDILLTFDCLAGIKIPLEIKDENGKPTTAALEITDSQGRAYPSTAKRSAPDFHFHPQIYRHDGESIHLPRGDYQIRITRGPEYLEETKSFKVDDEAQALKFQLRRWIDPSLKGWWSGDHHIHAAGCAHYADPTQGVHAPDMLRHCQGEDLKIGANLTWGPCFDYQKQFFTGTIDKVSTYPYLLRYDIEVSGFGSHESGHLCLLRLKDQMYPGGNSTTHWPKLGLNTLRWAQKQGAVCGPAHSGWGLEVKTDALPNFVVPPYSGIGANEYIVDVTHLVDGPDGTIVPAMDFISLCDTPMIWELNIWYHTLNCGFRTRGSGETDFPCIYGERVGLGRSYVKIAGELTYDAWCEGISRGNNYVSDGRSHLMDFCVANKPAAEKATQKVPAAAPDSEHSLSGPGVLKFSCDVAALLPEVPTGIAERPYAQQPYWHIERARIGKTREVPVELIVNGFPVERQQIVADGVQRTLTFETRIERSSWVALRILGSSHTNPIFVIVDEQPIRASKRSAQWCLDGVEQCWGQKQRFFPPEEMEDAVAAYDHARQVYRKIIEESPKD
ncbi:MAG: CehA/McbA family metallohydrolase [Pirellulaceae bacterium]